MSYGPFEKVCVFFWALKSTWKQQTNRFIFYCIGEATQVNSQWIYVCETKGENWCRQQGELKSLFFDCIFLGVTILLSLTVFLNLVAETLPQVSDAIPLLGSRRKFNYFYRHFFLLFFIRLKRKSNNASKTSKIMFEAASK